MPSLLDLWRTAAALVAVAMNAALIAFAFIISDSARTQMQTGARLSMRDANVAVQEGRRANSTEGALDDSLVKKISAPGGVASVRDRHWNVLVLDLPKQLRNTTRVTVNAQDIPTLGRLTTLNSGRLPTASGKVAISTLLAEQQGLSVDSTTRLTTNDIDNNTGTPHNIPTIIGIVSPGPDTEVKGIGMVYTTTGQLKAIGANTSYHQLYVVAKPETDTAALTSTVEQTAHVIQPHALVQSRETIIPQRSENQQGGMMIVTILDILAPVCVMIAVIVIATTFSILVARQTRTTGLMCCIGATRRQVMPVVLRTGLVTSLFGSVLDTATGTEIASVVISSRHFADLEADQLTISPVSLVLTIAVGTLVTLIAVLRPARRAARISPLVALTGQVASVKQAGHTRVWAAVAGVVIAGVGTAVIALSVQIFDICVIAGGSAVVILGTVLGLPTLVAVIIGLIDRISSGTQLPVLHLATRNLTRNSGQSAAATVALFVCVLVRSVLFVGLPSLNASLESILDHSSPMDVRIFGVTPQANTTRLTQQIKAVDGTQDVTCVPTLGLTQAVNGQAKNIVVDVIGTRIIASIVCMMSGLEDLDDGTLIIDELYGIPGGSKVTLTGAAGSAELAARVREGWGGVITPATAQCLNKDTPTSTTMWVRSTGSTMTPTTGHALHVTIRGQGLMVSGNVAGVELMSAQIMKMALIIYLVLGSILVIALLGLANTTDVSVLEWVRETGVLCATGSSCKKIRCLIVTEGVLVAAMGRGLGLLVGTALGVSETLAMARSVEGMTVHVPSLWLLTLFTVALAVGLTASVRPAGQTTSAPPVRALSEE